VALDDIDAAHLDPALGAQDLDHLTALAAVAAGDDDHLIAFLILNLGSHSHSTSGASEMIFMKFLERSSRVTGPKIGCRSARSAC